jgi:CDP-ribitol ribitolphosphotransferase
MKVVLFCYHPYAFGIVRPLHDALIDQDHETIWYVRPAIADYFTKKTEVDWTSSLKIILDFAPDAIFVPGNEVPH